MADGHRTGLILASDLRGLPPDQARRPARDRALTRLRRGAYVDTELWGRSRPAEKYRLKVLSTLAAMRSPSVLSHESAAVMHGLPVIGRWPSRVHVVEEARSGGRSSALIVRHGVKQLPGIIVLGDIAVTSVARTVIDLARTRPFASALATADHALASGLCTIDDLRAEVDLAGTGRGSRSARYVVERANGLAQSVGESLSRARMYELRLPVPVLQQEFFDDDGLVGRVDFWWETLRLIGEFDGRTKYRANSDANLPPEEVVWLEKRREDRLRPMSAGFARWTWEIALDRNRFLQVMVRAGVHPQ
jgi:hypothetical protein